MYKDAYIGSLFSVTSRQGIIDATCGTSLLLPYHAVDLLGSLCLVITFDWTLPCHLHRSFDIMLYSFLQFKKCTMKDFDGHEMGVVGW